MKPYWVFDKLDAAAFEALREYRRMIGLADAVPTATQVSERFRITGRWLDTLALWDLFITATFRYRPRRLAGPGGLARVELVPSDGEYSRAALPGDSFPLKDFSLRSQVRPASENYVRHSFDRFRRFLQRTLHAPVSYDVGFEAGIISGQAHFHALLHARGLREVRRDELWRILYDNFGCALVLAFEPGRGAGWYFALAYVGKRSLGWDLHIAGRSHLRNRPAIGGHAPSIAPSANCERSFFRVHPRGWHR
jgi:hypothetical protein